MWPMFKILFLPVVFFTTTGTGIFSKHMVPYRYLPLVRSGSELSIRIRAIDSDPDFEK